MFQSKNNCIAEVVVDVSNDNVDKVFDYIAPLSSQIGMRVMVPFGHQVVLGYIINKKDSTDYQLDKLKSIHRLLDNEPLLSAEMLSLSKYMAQHFFLRLCDVFKLMLPSSVRLDKVKESTIDYVELEKNVNFDETIKLIKNAKQQARIVSYLYENGRTLSSNLIQLFGRSAYNSLLEKKLIVKDSVRVYREQNYKVLKNEKIVLTQDQERAINTIKSRTGNYLIQGVTGSGKTEIYMNIIDEILKQGKSAIMLVPEISLTPQMLSRFKSRFGDTVAVLHSGLSAGEKYDEWTRIFNGEAKVVLGARSAIFAPLKDIGVIIIDEEHDRSYTSETNPRYVTEDVALYRAKYNECSMIMGSATPSIETYKKAKESTFQLIELPNRINDIKMPDIEIVDMLGEVLDGNTSAFSRKLLSQLKKTMDDKKQAMIFINRRGYASFVMCKECGYVAKCDDCEVALVYHKEDNELKCHFCGKRYRALTNCPNCNSKYIKYGAIGTERVVNELKEIFPNIPIHRMDNDTTRGKDGHRKVLEQFSSVTPSILVGTQMIAKGHDFPLVSFVGIIDADVSLYNSDFRSVENTFQLVTQVSGRAGRKNGDGKVVLQTYSPKHYVYKYATNYDYKGFFTKEINLRQTTGFPPFSTIMRILISSSDNELAVNATKELYEKSLAIKEKYGKQIIFMQAMPSPVKRIQTKYRYQILFRFLPNEDIRFDIFKISDIIYKNVSIFVETNPQNLR
ncbi:MAG: primosomal protein N' [Clostridia bacterium]|nr:primosomal protein N' [Clostridia bacterium]